MRAVDVFGYGKLKTLGKSKWIQLKNYFTSLHTNKYEKTQQQWHQQQHQLID